MLAILQVVALLLVALAMTPALAHALEWPGKKRLSKDEYLAVQTIYYPGFVIIGFSELAAILATLALLFVVPSDSLEFWLTLLACLALVVMHAVFWVFTQPVNKFWLREQELKGAGKAFFDVRAAGVQEKDWQSLRNRWEYSHVARSVLALAALGLFASAVTMS